MPLYRFYKSLYHVYIWVCSGKVPQFTILRLLLIGHYDGSGLNSGLIGSMTLTI